MSWILGTRGLALLWLLACAGCAGNGVGLDQNGNRIGSGGDGTTPLTADLDSIQANVFTPICTRCHIGASAPEGLRLDAADSYNLLVGVPSVEQPSVLRVSPGNPDASYIIQKLEGIGGIVGGQMPLGGPYLPQSTIDVIRQWITNGAPKTAGLTAAIEAAQPFAVTGTAPMNGAVVKEPMTRLLVAFNRDVDASLVNDTTVTLVRLADNNSPMPVLVALVPANPAVIMLTVPAALAPGTYQVRLRGTGAAALADMNAVILGKDDSFMFTVDATP